MSNQLIKISIPLQTMVCFESDKEVLNFKVSTGLNGPGEQMDSECTPRGWHCVHSILGQDARENSVFVARKWTGEVYDALLGLTHPTRDWILTRIVQLDGLEPGRNQGGDVDSLNRYIYIHGTPDSVPLGIPGSKGCVRMNNKDIIDLTTWLKLNTKVFIE